MGDSDCFIGLINPDSSSFSCSDAATCDGKLSWLDGTVYQAPTMWSYLEEISSNSPGDHCIEMDPDGSLDETSCTSSKRFVCKLDCSASVINTSTCPDGITTIPAGYVERAAGKHYMFTDTDKTYDEATDFCAADGASLAVISSQEDYIAVTSLAGKLIN